MAHFLCPCSSYPLPESQAHSSAPAPHWPLYTEPRPCPVRVQWWWGTRQWAIQLWQIPPPCHLLKERSWLEDSLFLTSRWRCHGNCLPLWRWRRRSSVWKRRLEKEAQRQDGGHWWHSTCWGNQHFRLIYKCMGKTTVYFRVFSFHVLSLATHFHLKLEQTTFTSNYFQILLLLVLLLQLSFLLPQRSDNQNEFSHSISL